MLTILSSVCRWQVIVALALGCLVYWFVTMWLLRRKLPPGPFPLPIVGNVLMMVGKPVSQEYFRTLAKNYGDPMSFWIGNKLAIILDSKETIRDVLVNQQAKFSDRPDSLICKKFLVELARPGFQDIALGKYGPMWRLHKKLANKGMRAIIDNEKLEEKVNDVVQDVVEAILQNGNKPINVAKFVSNTIYNIMASFAYGQTYDSIDHPEFQQLLNSNKRANELFPKLVVLDFLPLVNYLPLAKIFSAAAELASLLGWFLTFLDEKLKEHRKTYQDVDSCTDEIRDFTDAMIFEQKELDKQGEKEAQMLTDDHVTAILMDFFIGGSDTTSSSMIWFLLYMIMYPENQEKCHKLITLVIGDRSPAVKDRAALPLVEACIMEALRLRPPLPLGVPHLSTQNAQLGAYSIPKDTILVANLHSMHVGSEGDFSPDPEQFDPELHFLDGNTVRKPGGFMPFGGGRRVCLGEQLARNNLFLVATGLLQKLKFSKVDGETYSLDCDPAVDAACYAKPYVVRCEAR